MDHDIRALHQGHGRHVLWQLAFRRCGKWGGGGKEPTGLPAGSVFCDTFMSSVYTKGTAGTGGGVSGMLLFLVPFRRHHSPGSNWVAAMKMKPHLGLSGLLLLLAAFLSHWVYRIIELCDDSFILVSFQGPIASRGVFF